MEDNENNQSPRSPQERILAIATVVIGLLAVVVILVSVPLKYGVGPAALIALLLFAKFLHGKTKIKQASNHMAEARKRLKRDQGRR